MGIFGKFKRKPRMEQLIDDLSIKNLEVRTKAVIELANLGESAVVPLLENLKTAQSSFTKAGPHDALAMIGEPAIDPLIRVIKESENTKLGFHGAVLTFAKMADGANGSLSEALKDKAVEPLIEALSRNDCKQYTFIFLSTALERIGDPRAIEPMKRALEESKDDGWIKSQVKERLDELQKKWK